MDFEGAVAIVIERRIQDRVAGDVIPARTPVRCAPGVNANNDVMPESSPLTECGVPLPKGNRDTCNGLVSVQPTHPLVPPGCSETVFPLLLALTMVKAPVAGFTLWTLGPCRDRTEADASPRSISTRRKTANGGGTGHGESRHRYDSTMSETRHEFPVGPAAVWDGALPPEVQTLADQLMPLFYDDLKRLAHRERSRVGAGATLQTTALVNEAYLKLRGSQGWNTDAHFLRAAALAMRHALVSHALARQADKRGGGAAALPISDALEIAVEDDAAVLALNEALARLARDSLRLAQVVECRYFGGYDEAETGCALGISERTVRRDWTLARAWLHRELAGAG